MKRLLKTVAAVLALTAAGAAISQSYPARPVRIMVGYSPGGGVDTTARIVAAALSDLWGSTVIVENRPGAAGNIATEYTVKAAPDGYTLVLCNIGSHGVTPARFRKRLSYDPVADFAFPVKIGGVPNVFMVHPSMPMRTLRDYIAYAKKHPGKLNFGSSGVGASPHMSIELLKTITGINIVHVPYKGAAAALAVTSGKRNVQIPDVPTFQESGVPGYEVTGWYGLCTQAKVPQPILTKLNADMNRLLTTSPLRKRLEDQGIDVSPATPEEFAAHVKSEIAKWTKVVRDAKLEAE